MNDDLKFLENAHEKEESANKPRRPATVGERVKKLRLALGYTRPAFGDAVGVSASTVNAWETEGAIPSPSVVDAIHRTFVVDKTWLLTGKGRPFPNLLNAAASLTLCPRAPFLSDESVPFDDKTRAKTRRFVAALTPRQRDRALLFYADLVAVLAQEGADRQNRGDAA